MGYTIELFADYIRKIDTDSQSVFVESISKKWEKHYHEFSWLKGILESLKTDRGYKLSRKDIFETKDRRERLIKTIFWGFPDGYRSPATLRNILLNIDGIKNALPDYGKQLKEAEYISLFRNLCQFDGLQESTISKILCFWRIKVASSEAIIVDQYVRESSHLFFQLWGTSLVYPYSAEDNYFVVKKVNSLARSMNVRPQQLEYFLFNTGKIAKNNRLSLFKQLLQFAGVSDMVDLEDDS